VLQTLTSEVMTFSFDVKAPITIAPGGQNELMLRAGVGTAADMLGSGDQIFEAIIFRNTNRGAYTNNGNESIFVVANNKATDLTYPSPIDGSDITLTGYQYSTFVRNNSTNGWGLIKSTSDMADQNDADPGPGTITRFALGNGNNGYQGTFVVDNLRVVEGVAFVPEPATAVMLSLAGASFLFRRRR
jgi:hypothetical protein